MKKILTIFAFSLMFSVSASATSNNFDFIIYRGKLTNQTGEPITSTIPMRFSLWKNADAVPSDFTETGNINMKSPNSAYWYEQFIVTPDPEGNFAVALGSIIKNKFRDHLFLQIELKDPKGKYHLLDMFSDSTIDRQSIPFLLQKKINLTNQEETIRLEQNLSNSSRLSSLAMGDLLNEALDMDETTQAITISADKKIFGTFLSDVYCNAGYGACFHPGENPATEDKKEKMSFASMLKATLFSPAVFSKAQPQTPTAPKTDKTTAELLNTIKLLQEMIVDLNMQIKELKAQK